jgi:hypothetical protein
MNQLIYAGVNVVDIFAKKFGKSKEEIKRMISEGSIGARDAMVAILDSLDARFGGTMKKMQNTPKQAIENFKDSIWMLNAAMGDMADKSFGITKNLNAMKDKIVELSNVISSGSIDSDLARNIQLFKDLGYVLVGVVVTAFSALIAKIGLTRIALTRLVSANPIGAFVTISLIALDTLTQAGAWDWLIEKAEQIKNAFKGIGDWYNNSVNKEQRVIDTAAKLRKKGHSADEAESRARVMVQQEDDQKKVDDATFKKMAQQILPLVRQKKIQLKKVGWQNKDFEQFAFDLIKRTGSVESATNLLNGAKAVKITEKTNKANRPELYGDKSNGNGKDGKDDKNGKGDKQPKEPYRYNNPFNSRLSDLSFTNFVTDFNERSSIRASKNYGEQYTADDTLKDRIAMLSGLQKGMAQSRKIIQQIDAEIVKQDEIINNKKTSSEKKAEAQTRKTSLQASRKTAKQTFDAYSGKFSWAEGGIGGLKSSAAFEGMQQIRNKGDAEIASVKDLVSKRIMTEQEGKEEIAKIYENSFSELKKYYQEHSTEMGGVSQSLSEKMINDILDFTKKAKDATRDYFQEFLDGYDKIRSIKDGISGGFGKMGGAINSFFGGKTKEEQIAALEKEKEEKQKKLDKLGARRRPRPVS